MNCGTNAIARWRRRKAIIVFTLDYKLLYKKFKNRKKAAKKTRGYRNSLDRECQRNAETVPNLGRGGPGEVFDKGEVHD